MNSSERRVRVLAFLPHAKEAPGTRYRVLQYLPHLRERGIDVDTTYFFDSADHPHLHVSGRWARKARATAAGGLRRAMAFTRAREYDVLLVYLWLAPTTFPPFDWALRRAGRPIVYDLDDPYYASGASTVRALRDPGWIPRLMRPASHVVVGSEPIAEFARSHSSEVSVIPTVIDTDKFAPRDFVKSRNPRPVIGWVGSRATAHFLEPLAPVLRELARRHDFVLRIVGAGREMTFPGVDVECQAWQLAREVDHFRDLDIGLYPLDEGNAFARAKHGFKMHMYMSVGVPPVASAMGLDAHGANGGETALFARTLDDWGAHLETLLRHEDLRHRMGSAGRAEVVRNWSLRAHVDRWTEILRSAADLGAAPTPDGVFDIHERSA